MSVCVKEGVCVREGECLREGGAQVLRFFSESSARLDTLAERAARLEAPRPIHRHLVPPHAIHPYHPYLPPLPCPCKRARHMHADLILAFLPTRPVLSLSLSL